MTEQEGTWQPMAQGLRLPKPNADKAETEEAEIWWRAYRLVQSSPFDFVETEVDAEGCTRL